MTQTYDPTQDLPKGQQASVLLKEPDRSDAVDYENAEREAGEAMRLSRSDRSCTEGLRCSEAGRDALRAAEEFFSYVAELGERLSAYQPLEDLEPCLKALRSLTRIGTDASVKLQPLNSQLEIKDRELAELISSYFDKLRKMSRSLANDARSEAEILDELLSLGNVGIEGSEGSEELQDLWAEGEAESSSLDPDDEFEEF